MRDNDKNCWEERDNPVFNENFPYKIAEIVPSILYTMDVTAYKIVYCNKKVIQSLGYTPEEIIQSGKEFVFEHMHPQDQPSFMQHIEELKETAQGEVRIFEYQLKTASGDWKWFQSRDTVYELKEDGSVNHIIGTAIEITVRKEMEKRLSENQEQLIEAQKIAKLGHYTFDISTRTLSISNMLSLIFGIEESLNIDHSIWTQVVHPDFREKFLELFKDAINKKSTSFEMNYQIICQKTQKTKWVHGSNKLIYNDRNEAIKIFGTVLDITQQMTVRDKLAQSNEKLDNIIQHSSSLFYTHNPDGFLTYLSPQSKEILDCEPEMAMSHWQEFITDNAANKPGIQLTSKALKTGKKQPQYTLELKTRTGRTIWVRVDESPVVKDGKTIAIVGSLTDITKQVNNELRLKELNTTKDKLFSIVSHDLRSPIGAIINLAELALENIEEPNLDDLKKYLGIINKSGQQSINLLNNLLEWSALNTGRIKVDPVSIQLQSCIENIGELFKSQIIHKRITFTNSVPTHLTIQADEKLINTVLRNLISNAIKFTPKNGLITIKARRTEAENVISVSDTGVGIDKVDMDKLFDPNIFFSKYGTDKERGSGLGLLLCSEFVKIQNGQLKVISKLDKGTTFKILLPHTP